MIRTVTIVGMGRVGGAIATRLRERGVTVHGIARQDFQTWLTTHGSIGQMLILAVGDAVMPSVVSAIASSSHSLIDVIALHVNGSLRPYVLHPLTTIGATLASAHPFQTFATADASALDGIGWGVECTDDDWPHIDDFVHRTGGIPVRLTEMTDDRKRVYHASAVAASNFAYAAYELGRRLAAEAGVPADIMLPPIIERTYRNAANALQTDAPFGMTGPIVRGDVEALRKQYQAMPASLRTTYRHLALALIDIVRTSHSDDVITSMRRVIE